MESGIERIAAERQRQIDVEGYNAEHDADHTVWDLINAARAYMYGDSESWPWDKESFKPHTKTEDLTKAGALIAAAIDRDNQPKPRCVTAEEYADMIVESIAEDICGTTLCDPAE